MSDQRIIKELQSSAEESRREWTEIREMFKETDRRFKETDRKFKETGQKINQLAQLFESQWGKLIESLVDGDLVRLLNQRGIAVQETSTRHKGRRNGEQFEFDIIAHNGDEIVIVEVKTTMKVKSVKKHLEKLKKIKSLIPAFKNQTVYGAMAYLQADEQSEVFAESQKLFVIKATGDSSSIINAPDFVPASFGN